MTIFAIVMSSLALLAATTALALTICDRKRGLERNTALTAQLKDDVAAAIKDSEEKSAAAIKDSEEKSAAARKELSRHIADLENGVVPDFEKAKAAAKAVDDFNTGISGILGFDPHEALRKQRSENYGGEDG